MTDRETVVLVHGLWMHGVVMTYLRWRMKHCGYHSSSFSYRSVRLTLTENARRLARYCRDVRADRLHFVGHSLGGLVILRFLEDMADDRVGRIVLVGSPCSGSFSAERLASLPGGRAALGRSVPEWLAAPHSPALLGYEIGGIAGSLRVGLGRLISPDLPRPNDGVVTVAESRLPEMRDHVVLPVSHSGMLLSGGVGRQACHFLRHGHFLKTEPERRES